jgi:hypothetical protein
VSRATGYQLERGSRGAKLRSHRRQRRGLGGPSSRKGILLAGSTSHTAKPGFTGCMESGTHSLGFLAFFAVFFFATVFLTGTRADFFTVFFFGVFLSVDARGFLGAPVPVADFFLAAVLLTGTRADFFGVFLLAAFLPVRESACR